MIGDVLRVVAKVAEEGFEEEEERGLGVVMVTGERDTGVAGCARGAAWSGEAVSWDFIGDGAGREGPETGCLGK